MVKGWLNKRLRGQQAEQQAARWLDQQGLRQVAANYHCRQGEIDLIMEDQDMLVFVEVRYRTSTGFGGALASVTAGKRQRITRAARHFLANRPEYSEHACRFDVLAMEPDDTGAVRYEWVSNAFYEEH